MYSSGTFQDLINLDTTNENIEDVIDDLKALEQEVDDNKLDISANTLAIGNNTTAINVNSGLIITNTTNISNNGVLITNNTNNINTNTNNIITNTSAISSNTANIATNSSSIATLNNEVLKKDGSVQLDPTFTPTNTYDLVSKDYVDSHSTSTAYLKVDGSNSMTGNLDIAGNSIYLDTSSNYIRSVANEIFLVAPNEIALQVGGSSSFIGGVLKNVMFKNLDMVNNDFINVGTINSISPSQITTNQTNISNNTSNITTNTNNITTNTNNITTNTNNIITNTNNIATNTNNISTNTTDILTKLSRNGDIITGTNPLGFGSSSKFISGQTGYLSITSNESIHLNTSANPTVRITQTYIENNLNTTINGNLTFTGNINNISPTVFNYISGLTSDAQTQINSLSSSKLSKSGGTMTGDINMGLNTITDCNIIENHNASLPNQAGTGGNDLVFKSHYWPALGNYSFHDSITIKALDNVLGNGSVNIGSALSTIGHHLFVGNGQHSIRMETTTATDNTLGMHGGTINGPRLQGRFGGALSVTHTGPSGSVPNQQDILTWGGEFGDVEMYNDLTVNGSLSAVGGTLTGDLNMSNNKITNLANGTVSTDAVNKSQLDTKYPTTGGSVNGYVEVDDGLKVIGDYGDMWGSGGAVGSGFYGLKQLWLKNTSAGGTGTGGDAGWFIGNQYSTTTSNDNDLYFQVQYYNGTQRLSAYIQDATTNVRMNFTGQHRCMPNFTFSEDKIGLIVETTGRYMNLIKEGEECSQISCITINDSIPVVQLCNEEKSKKVFGVISNEEEKTRTYASGNFGSFYDKVEGDNRLYINSIGEGGIWICNKNGNLENGDYICSAGINGYGMRQAMVNLTNYTVAKITMDCDFNPQLEEVKIWENGGWVMTGKYKPQYECIELDDGMKVAFVGCTYHCG